MDASVPINEPPKAKRIRTYSPETKANHYLRQKKSRQLANAELQTRLLNNEISDEELQGIENKRLEQKKRNEKFKASGKQPNRSSESLDKRRQEHLTVLKNPTLAIGRLNEKRIRTPIDPLRKDKLNEIRRKRSKVCEIRIILLRLFLHIYVQPFCTQTL